MISIKEIEKIKEYYENGIPVVRISEILQRSVPSVYKYLKFVREDLNLSEKDNESFISLKIKPFTDSIRSKLKKGIVNNTRIYRELVEDGFKGSYGLLNKYLQDEKEKKIPINTRLYQKIETEPGEQAQVDWGHFGKISINGMLVNLYVFVYVLSYSRSMYAEFTTSQRQQVFQNCHINAFEKLGVPKKIRYDNIKTVIISRDKSASRIEKINYNFDFLSFSRYYKFDPDVCPPYYPQSKGKVEAGVKYLRRNFMVGEIPNKTFKSLDEINEKLFLWLENFANNRIHASTKQKPKELWLNEKKELFIIDNYPRYKNTYNQSRRASPNSMVTYKKSSYAVPPEFARKKIDIEEKNSNGINKLFFYFKGLKIVEHVKSDKIGAWILPTNYGLKTNDRNLSIEQRVTSNPKYKTKVEVRDMNYYNKFI